MAMEIKINSEIGQLKKVWLHRPGKEVERLYPEIFERILFDDIMHTEQAQLDHDVFAKILKDEGVEIFYVEKVAAEVFDAKPELRDEFLKEFIERSGAKHPAVKKAAFDFWNKITDNHELMSTIIAGIMKDEVKPAFDNSMASTIEQHDKYPFYIDPIPNILFQRDAIASIYDGMNIHEMAKETRRRESIFYEFILAHHPDWKGTKTILNKGHAGTIEGGDILIMNSETLFVGVSERTTAPAVEALAAKVLEMYPNAKRVVGIEIPKTHATMHLDTVFTQMDADKFSVDYDMANEAYYYYEMTRDGVNMGQGRIDELLIKFGVSAKPQMIICGGGSVVHAKAEQWNDGANCLTVSPGVIVVYDRNTHTNAAIEAAGVKLLKVPSGELSRGRGGPRCMSMPIFREDL